MSDLQSFQAFLYQNIPLVENMQLKLQNISEHQLSAAAPLSPNINDKFTVFGGSSSALMTICGWSLIKYHLEAHEAHHDVVIHQAKTHWTKAQSDDLIIKAKLCNEHNWEELAQKLNTRNRTTKITVKCQVYNQNHEVCSTMTGDYVVLKQQH